MVVLGEDLRDYAIGRHIAYVVDPAHTLDFNAARTSPDLTWQLSRNELPAFGFDPATYWLRFDLHNPASEPGDWVLELAYPLLDEVDLYVPQSLRVSGSSRNGADELTRSAVGGYTLHSRGDLRSFHKRDVQHRDIVFPLEIPPGTHRLYARVRTSSSVNLYFNLWQADDFLDRVYSEQLVLGLYYGVMVVMTIYNFFLFIFIRDRSYLYYVLYILGYTLYQATLNGLSFQYLWPEWIWWANNSLPFFMAFGSMWGLVFTRSFLNTRTNNPAVDKALLGFTALNAINMPLAMLLPYEFIIKLATATIALSVLLIFFAGLRSFVVGYKPARYFLIAWTTLIFGIFVFALKSFGILPSNFTTNWAQQIGSAAEVLLLSLALADRINIIKKEKEQAQSEAILNLKKTDLLKDEFLARTSHELKTPLNGIIGLAEGTVETVRGRQGIPKRTFFENMDMIVSSGRRLATLVNDILDFSRLKNADIQLRLCPVDAKRVLQVVAALARPLLSSQNGQQSDANSGGSSANAGPGLEVDCPEDLPLALADEDRLQQIVLNLVGNAVKFTHEGAITIGARLIADDTVSVPASDGAHIEIYVSDTGIGIPLEKQEQIFDSFQQAEDSIAREYGGTGLGLAIVRSLVQLHGSRVELESAAGQGSRFSFRLPVAADQNRTASNEPQVAGVGMRFATEIAHEGPALAERASANPGEAGEEKAANLSANTPPTSRLARNRAPEDGSRPKILCVDDEPVNRRVLETMLQTRDYEILVAEDGPRALELLERHQPDMVLLDLMMPRMSGFEVISRIREAHSASLLPVIILSAKNQVTDLVQGLDLGANDYLTKPFSREELLARMEVHLDLRSTIRLHMRQSRALQRFVPTEFLDLLGRGDITEVEHGDSSRLSMSVLFSDIRAFSALAEELGVDDNFRFLNDYLKHMVPGIQKHGGFVDKFIGDAIMALFPDTAAHSADGALQAALGMRAALQQFNAERSQDGRPAIDFGIGINTGDLMIGTVGTHRRLDTTVIGDTVNLASRLQSLTTLYRVPILISDHTLRSLSDPDAIAAREVDSVTVKGKRVPVVVYEVYESDDPETRAAKDHTKADFTRGIILYKSRNFADALDIFRGILAEHPGDAVAELYTRRCQEYIEHPPAENWQGVVDLQHK